MLVSNIITDTVAIFAALAGMAAEKHTVSFVNKCGHGTPLLKADGKTLSKGKDYTIHGRLISAIAYLQTGHCGDNGESCTLIETTLKNPTKGEPGSGSSTDISLIPPHKFSVTSGFGYIGAGCDHLGADCKSEKCKTAFHYPNDTDVQVACQGANVDLVITFCD
ncbi:glycopeptide [Phanerochaete sordida]|uniref:Glycopeptide n=1 Tax=Phanerochaete sordida TaxID=48140 RepID=A0A9P3LKE5_9APHY|nr:glycopeptide [Phanerochaete sordida]